MRRVLSLLPIAALLLMSCETTPWQSRENEMPPVELLEEEGEGVATASPPEAGLALNTEQRFADVPLPADVRCDTERTYVYESDDLQVGRMVYYSKASIAELSYYRSHLGLVDELAQFYIKECPAADWKLESVLQADGAQLLFRKPGKRLSIDIRPQGVARSRLLILNLTPESGGSEK